MGDDQRHGKIQERAYRIWEREGGGDPEQHWHRAEAEIDRELSMTAGNAPPREIASTDVLTVEELAMRTGISGKQAQDLIDRLGNDRAAIEQAALGLKGKRRRNPGQEEAK
ncbi:DUF2934 domain-containing protein [Mesorhizobium sp. B1-1-1]|uniref:DUF2934 domain-containing protein n=1 Tax=Mesorhizobium sp. B1-1-1 TaxID=2589983 RepID=UPI001127C619|nr:DUF2934 domain-containing protein [Mesorhizobium sp. B1-1-1]TPN67235.1 DUF2934 domain-containing protein [Mesorhizobium sp. B1-1-1]